MFVRGLMATLGAEGVDPEAPEDLITWAAGKDRPAVLLTVLTPREWTLLAEVLRARSDAVVVATPGHPGPDHVPAGHRRRRGRRVAAGR